MVEISRVSHELSRVSHIADYMSDITSHTCLQVTCYTAYCMLHRILHVTPHIAYMPVRVRVCVCVRVRVHARVRVSFEGCAVSLV